MKKIFLIATLIFSVGVIGQEINIIPQPQKVEIKEGQFEINQNTVIIYSKGNIFSAQYLQHYINKYYGINCNLTRKLTTDNSIWLIATVDYNGSYTLDINNKGVQIAGDSNGVFYGIQTLIQLLPTTNPKLNKTNLKIPHLNITDSPRFPYRGMHLDVCRHFFPVSFVKKYIDYLAFHKLNVFHWHLTEDQGWRIEIKKYPELTSIGSKRNGTIIGRYPGTGNDNTQYGGSYTQDEIKEVVQYAKARYIEVIPEIEMPGHGSAAIAAYPWLSCFPEKPTEIPKSMISDKSVEEQKNGRLKLVQETWGVFDDIFCAGKDSTFLFLQNVIDEVIPLFPSKYFHIGGDEAPKTHWKQCPNCQKKIKELGLKDEHELQSWFVQRIEKYLKSKGKTLIGWDEILEGGLAPNAVVMSWRGEAGGIEAAKQKHNVIMTPGSPLYFDHTQSENEDSVTIGGYNPIEKVYAYEPIPKELTEAEGKYILGAQANVWAEYIGNEKKVEYMIFPRMAALSEILWSPKEKRDWKDFENRLPEQMKRYENWGANYSKAYYDLKASVLPSINNDKIEWKLEAKNKNAEIFYIERPSMPDFVKYKEPIKIKNSLVYIAKQIIDGKEINRLAQAFHISKATGKKITLINEASKNYPGDGAFTLVNGIINEKGRARSKEFLGFSGTDCDALIQLGSFQEIKSVTVHTFQHKNSWIWQPLSIEAFTSVDGMYFSSLGTTTKFIESQNGNGTMTINFNGSQTNFVRVIIKNQGKIPDGNPGEGKNAWLFVDEIEVR